MSAKVVQFSDVCGENVNISEDKTTATWVSKNSDGWACSEVELKPGDIIEVKVEGSGRCDIGLMREEQSPGTFKILNEIRAHRRTCCIEVTFKENGEEILSKFTEKTFKKKIEKDTKAWLAVYIRYGDMSVEMLTKGQSPNNQSNLKFSSAKHGTNIQLENDNTMAVSISKNPASTCFISERLEVRGTLHLNCSPEKEGERKPSRYELKLHVCETDPATLKNEFRYLFDASEARTSDPPLTTIESIEKDECNGPISITLSDSKTIQYKTARGKHNTQILKCTTENGVWVVLGLYRVRVQAENNEVTSGAFGISETCEATAALDQPDSLPLRPRPTVVPPERVNPQPVGEPGAVVKHLTGRVMSLEQELENLRLRTHISESSQPQAAPIPDINVITESLGEELNLQRRFPDLVRDIDTMTFCDHLYSHNVLTSTQMEAVHAIHTQKGSPDANREILKVMKTKRIEKSVMIQILEETQQQHLLQLFYPPNNSTAKR